MGATPDVTVSSLDIGPAIVTFDGDDIGATLDNVTINWKFEKAALKADQYGSTLLDKAVTGIEATIELSIAEVQDKDKVAALFANAVLITDMTTKAIEFGDRTAVRQLDLAKVLTIHPLVKDTTDVAMDWTAFKALPNEESSYVLGPAEQGKMKIVFDVYLDTSVSPARMFRLGDTTI